MTTDDAGAFRNSWWYHDPAAVFSEGLPLGTGRLGATVYGRVGAERIPFDEESLWAGQPYDPHNPQAARGLEQVRALVRDGEYRAASERAQKLFAPIRDVQSYQPTGSLRLRFEGHDVADVDDYVRELDMADGVARVRYRHEGTTYEREIFASTPDGVVVVRLSCDEPGGLSFSATLDTVQPDADYRTPGEGSRSTAADEWAAALELGGGTGPVYEPPVSKKIVQSHVRWAARLGARADEGRVEVVEAGSGDELGSSDGGGSDTDAAPRLRIEGADAATLVVGARTSYEDWDWIDPSDAHRAVARADVADALDRGHAALRERHLSDWRPRFENWQLSLGGEDRADEETTARLAARRSCEGADSLPDTEGTDSLPGTEGADGPPGAEDPHLLAQYAQYGRHLLLAASRPGTLAYNNHNLWLDRDADGIEPRWDGRWTMNINLQQCYWPADTTGIGETNEALLSSVESLAAAGERTADRLFDCPGWVSSLGADAWMNTAPQHWDEGTIRGVAWGVFPTSGAWLCRRLYEHYRFDPTDDAFLARLYPLLEGAVRFFCSFLREDPETGWLVTNWSASPENVYCTEDGEVAAIDELSAIDAQLLRGLFSDYVAADRALRASAADAVDRDPSLVDRARDARERLPPHQVGDHGLQEWYEDRDEVEPGHRHLSHCYALYPGADVLPREDPELAAAVREAIERRERHGDGNLGWSGGWRACLWARLGEGDRAAAILDAMLTDGSIHPSEHQSSRVPSFDGNQGVQGVTAAVVECLVQSHAGEVDLLPALPAGWPSGGVEGLRARGGFTVDIDWAAGGLTGARVHAERVPRDREREQQCAIRTRTPVDVVDGDTVLASTEPDEDSPRSTTEHVAAFPVDPGHTYELRPR